MTLEQIKREALSPEAEQIEIMWDKLDSDPAFREDFEKSLQLVVKGVDGLEYIYKHLQAGTSIIDPEQETELTHDDIEQAKIALEDELFAAYQMVDVWDRYRAVNKVLNDI